MQRILQRADKTRVFIVAAFLVGTPLFARGQAPASPVSSIGFIRLVEVAPTSASTTNQAVTNTARRNLPTPRAHTRTKAGVLAAGALIAITILIVACGLA